MKKKDFTKQDSSLQESTKMTDKPQSPKQDFQAPINTEPSLLNLIKPDAEYQKFSNKIDKSINASGNSHKPKGNHYRGVL